MIWFHSQENILMIEKKEFSWNRLYIHFGKRFSILQVWNKLRTPFKHDSRGALFSLLSFVTTNSTSQREAQRMSCLKGVQRLLESKWSFYKNGQNVKVEGFSTQVSQPPIFAELNLIFHLQLHFDSWPCTFEIINVSYSALNLFDHLAKLTAGFVKRFNLSEKNLSVVYVHSSPTRQQTLSKEIISKSPYHGSISKSTVIHKSGLSILNDNRLWYSWLKIRSC